MIDFKNGSIFKLASASEKEYVDYISRFMVADEQILSTFKGIRDGVVFTNKRIIAINVQGVTGKKKDFTSLPYSKIQAFSVETAGVFDWDSELEIWFSGMGMVKFEFTDHTDITQICKIISTFTL